MTWKYRNLALIPQTRHYYRYGTFKDCSWTREEFMFCYNVRKKKDQQEARWLYKEYLDNKEYKKRYERESSDVWKV